MSLFLIASVYDSSENFFSKTILHTEQADRVVVELYRGLKASNIRSSRFAMTKLSEICHLTNPRKRRKLMLALTPLLRLIIDRQDEALQVCCVVMLYFVLVCFDSLCRKV